MAKKDKGYKLSSLLKFNSQSKFTWSKMSNFLSIAFYNVKKNPWLFTVMMLSTILDGAIASLLPIGASQMVSLIFNPGTTNTFLGLTMYWYSWIYVVLFGFLAMIVAEYIADYTIGMFAMRVEVQQRVEILNKLVDQDIDFFLEHASGNILTRLVADTQGLSLGIQQFLTNIVYAVAGVLTAAIVLFLKNVLLTGISVGFVVGVLLIGFVLFVFFRRALIRMFDFKREVDAAMTDRIINISLIKSSGQELQEIARNEKNNAIYSATGNSPVILSVILNVWIALANSFLPTIIVLIAISWMDPVELVPVLVTFIPNVGMLTYPIIMMIQTLRAATRASNCADRIGQLTKPKPTILENTNGPKINTIKDITFDGVAFAYPKYPEKYIIPPTTIKFEKGKSYAFVGETGSGKSTIAKLLLRLYDPVNGNILVNDKEKLTEVNLPSYLDRIGYVEQNPQIFFGNFWENISYGMFNATQKEIMAAAKKANLHDFIMTLPDKYETILGERGFLLSGGQKQRLVIARVFLKNPDLIILDEATSALDNIVEKEIQHELDKLVKGKTSVTIAHKLSTIKNVDEIYVLEPEKGVTQVGTFNELKAKPGHFKNLYEAGLMD